ncbi:hypothetical protein LJC22_05675 [Desulfosarcina sp. OttesenSCG-928-G10]|nr:hypothetical protein [Desulfosarcina sp. OttesenSCG-928-G10]MDL2322308.1 hypothetical protein [Desulfosarcina sp. OttesenSCG-928-B08]
MSDFDVQMNIDLRHTTQGWGDFVVDFEDGLPPKTEVTGVAIRAYAGRVTPDIDLSEQDDVANLIVDQNAVFSAGYKVYWRMQYSPDLAGKNVTLVFDITITTGGHHPFYAYRVRVR